MTWLCHEHRGSVERESARQPAIRRRASQRSSARGCGLPRQARRAEARGAEWRPRRSQAKGRTRRAAEPATFFLCNCVFSPSHHLQALTSKHRHVLRLGARCRTVGARAVLAHHSAHAHRAAAAEHQGALWAQTMMGRRARVCSHPGSQGTYQISPYAANPSPPRFDMPRAEVLAASSASAAFEARNSAVNVTVVVRAAGESEHEEARWGSAQRRARSRGDGRPGKPVFVNVKSYLSYVKLQMVSRPAKEKRGTPQACSSADGSRSPVPAAIPDQRAAEHPRQDA